jgi:hypothetical protein
VSDFLPIVLLKISLVILKKTSIAKTYAKEFTTNSDNNSKCTTFENKVYAAEKIKATDRDHFLFFAKRKNNAIFEIITIIDTTSISF